MSRTLLSRSLLGLALLASAQAQPASLRVQVGGGVLAGRAEPGLTLWQGVPYAAAPVGARRWRPPEPPPAWTGTRDAGAPGPVCLQRLALPGEAPRIRGSEDCLTLNVVSPAGARDAPVMVWLHGGSFYFGAGSDYDLRTLAREQGVVAVSVNYRLGAFGFLAAPGLVDGAADGPVGNYGLLDQQEALRWVKANIAAFGGDPGNVTVFGESAGGMSLCAQLAAPGAAGLFQKAIIQSGACTAPGLLSPRREALRRGTPFAQALGCAPTDAACLRALPAQKIVETLPPGAELPGQIPFPPLYGDATLPLEPGAAVRAGLIHRVPVLIGSNDAEGQFFASWLGRPERDLSALEYAGLSALLSGLQTPRVLRAYRPGAYGSRALAAAAAVTDGLFACPTNTLARALTPFVPVYSYEYRDPAPPNRLRRVAGIPRYGAFHTAELMSVLGTPLPEGIGDPAHFTPEQAALARTMRSYWANFARTGSPNGPGVPLWEPLSAAQNGVQALAPGGVGKVTDLRTARRCDEVWRR